ncbi:MAG: long-chain-fatty-acid--CoA ligase [Burkholderiaceae bacterium]|nr:long-chain-fatty-acid--CoA ligase [Burkholderiaceae bacterium]
MTKNILAGCLARAERHFADKPAIIYGDRQLTFAQVGEAASRLASALATRLGVSKGGRVALLLPNCPELTIADWALIRAGLVRVPLNPRLAPAEIEFMIQDSEAEVVVYGSDFESTVARLRETSPTLRHCIAVGAPGLGALAWTEVLAKGDPDNFHVDTDMDDLYMILYTSGTTGRPKGAVTTVRSRWFTVFTSAANENFVEESDVMLHVASLGHGSGTKVLNHYVKGATNVYLPKFTIEEFCQTVEARRATTTWVVPTIIGMLLDFPDRSKYDLSSLRTVVYGGAPMPVERLKKALATFGPIFVQVFGLSEAPHPIISMGKYDHIHGTQNQLDRRLSSAGRPSLGVEVRLVTEHGGEAEVGEIGEIAVRGDNVMVGYWKKPEATAEVIRDGWFYTGDLAIADRDGYIEIVDRKKDMIISGGYNVYPREVEEVLYGHPAVRECAVIGVPDAKWGEAVKAVVSIRPCQITTAEELLEHCRKYLASYKKPQSIDLIDELPKSPNGKILKRELRKPYWDARRRSI